MCHHDDENLSMSTLKDLCDEFEKNNRIDPSFYRKFRVKRGLRNADGSGVMAGLTRICNVHGYVISDGDKQPAEGKLQYRGIDVRTLVDNCVKEHRFGFEEVAWLLLFGKLPTRPQLERFTSLLAHCRELPDYFVEDMMIKAPSPNIMNKMARSVLALYSYDDNPEDTGLENLMRQSIHLIAQMPSIMVNAYQVKRRHYDRQTMYFHPIDVSQGIAESILGALRIDQKFTPEEAHLLDICLMLHAEHGGGNNSTFTARAVSSSGTDTYSAIAAAIGSLKGPRHGGANIKVNEMLGYIKEGVKDWKDDDEIAAFLTKLIQKEAGDHSGLIYGMGHAVYTLSDPRAVILKANAKRLAEQKGLGDDFALLDAVERLTPRVLDKVKGIDKTICANVDLYSGLVYRILDIPTDLFTPLFAIARTAGWCAHRIEELTTGNRIIRPAYKAVLEEQTYIPLNQRK